MDDHSRSIQERGSGTVAGLAVDGVTDAMLIFPHAPILPNGMRRVPSRPACRCSDE
jgi:hypothetical protein